MDDSETLCAVEAVEGDIVNQEEEQNTETSTFDDLKRLVDKHAEEAQNEVTLRSVLFVILRKRVSAIAKFLAKILCSKNTKRSIETHAYKSQVSVHYKYSLQGTL